jgi:hypothetical protein
VIALYDDNHLRSAKLQEAASMTEKPIAIVTGVGPGTGSAIVRRFAGGGFRVIALARSPDRIRALEKELPDTHAVICDVSDQGQVADAVANVRKSYGSPDVLIHNAVGGGWGTFLEIDPQMLERNFRVNVMGLLYLARELAPDMIAAGRGVHSRHRQHLRRSRQGQLCRFCADQGRPAHSVGIDCARSRAARHPRRLCADRCGNRWANAGTPARSAGRVFHQTIRDRRRIVAPHPPGPLGMVVPDRAASVRGKMVRSQAVRDRAAVRKIKQLIKQLT